jgi:hypothetical protein
MWLKPYAKKLCGRSRTCWILPRNGSSSNGFSCPCTACRHPDNWHSWIQATRTGIKAVCSHYLGLSYPPAKRIAEIRLSRPAGAMSNLPDTQVADIECRTRTSVIEPKRTVLGVRAGNSSRPFPGTVAQWVSLLKIREMNALSVGQNQRAAQTSRLGLRGSREWVASILTMVKMVETDLIVFSAHGRSHSDSRPIVASGLI